MFISKSPQKNIVERIFRDKEGRLVKATFYVYESGGHFKARLVKVEFIKEVLVLENKIFSLPGYVSQFPKYTEKISINGNIVSPYFNNNLLYFSGSKPRAPSKIILKFKL